jgi:hypothetical protein
LVGKAEVPTQQRIENLRRPAENRPIFADFVRSARSQSRDGCAGSNLLKLGKVPQRIAIRGNDRWPSRCAGINSIASSPTAADFPPDREK